jgi:hypothetical protein
MTALSNRKTRLRFETSDSVKGRAVVVDVSPFTASVRLKGTRTAFEISWAGIYYQAAKVAADRLRELRKRKA